MKREVIRIKEKYYILARSPRVDVYTRVLKHGESFAVFDRYGDIQPAGLGEQGIYHEGTRYLSRLQFLLYNSRPLLLSSTVRRDNTIFTVDMANPDIFSGDEIFIPKGSLHILRTKFLFDGNYYERIRIENFSSSPLDVSFSLLFGADFADIFEVRGAERRGRGRREEKVRDERGVIMRYEGLDGVLRETEITFSPKPKEISPSQATFDLRLPPKGNGEFILSISFKPSQNPLLPYRRALIRAKSTLRDMKGQTCQIHTSNEQFNAWLRRSLADIFMMMTQTPFGPYPYAGIPWFNTIFGRDGVITALETLWINPLIAKGVLSCLAATQAREEVPEQEAEPGKIVHEIRKGEMAATGDIPFAQYYGSVDATPLFVILAGAYYDRTEDRAFIERLWPSIEAALGWMGNYGDLDGDGFLEYQQGPKGWGLINKGWKDSYDGVFHADGALPKGPIALVEVQGYLYEAKRRGGELALLLGKGELAQRLFKEAEDLRERFEESFWCEEISTYALALDGDKRPCRVKTSNPGHCLFSGIVSKERALILAHTLLERDFFSGWGIRTVATSEALYNPLSYHNGSVWPHDNALIAYGFSRYGLKGATLRVMKGLFEASTYFDLNRLPELFCGFPRRPYEGPTLYPVACSPQAWASASVFLLLQACLGLSFKERKIYFHHPVLPDFLEEIWIRGLRMGEASVDLFLKRYEDDVVINVVNKRGEVEIVVLK